MFSERYIPPGAQREPVSTARNNESNTGVSKETQENAPILPETGVPAESKEEKKLFIEDPNFETYARGIFVNAGRYIKRMAEEGRMTNEQTEEAKEEIKRARKAFNSEHLDDPDFIEVISKYPATAENRAKVEEKKIDENLEREEHAVGKLSDDIHHIIKLIREKGNEANKIFVYVLPNEKQAYANNLDLIKKKIGMEVEIYAVNDKDKYDPENKSKKVKPGRPGIYAE